MTRYWLHAGWMAVAVCCALLLLLAAEVSAPAAEGLARELRMIRLVIEK